MQSRESGQYPAGLRFGVLGVVPLDNYDPESPDRSLRCFHTGVSGAHTPESPPNRRRSLRTPEPGQPYFKGSTSSLQMGRLVYMFCARLDFPQPSKDIPLLIVRISYTQTQRKSLRKSFISSSVFSLLRGRQPSCALSSHDLRNTKHTVRITSVVNKHPKLT